MANSYIDIQCEFCGETMRIAGYYPSIDLQIPEGVFPVLAEWMNEHLAHHQESLNYEPSLTTPGIKFVLRQI